MRDFFVCDFLGGVSEEVVFCLWFLLGAYGRNVWQAWLAGGIFFEGEKHARFFRFIFRADGIGISPGGEERFALPREWPTSQNGDMGTRCNGDRSCDGRRLARVLELRPDS
jgi:hypothetical protein